MSFRNTAQVWEHLRHILKGRWFRLEAVHPDGLPDLVGFHAGRTHWIEIKVHPDRLRPSQRALIKEAESQRVVVWVCHAKGARIEWRRGASDVPSPRLPDFLKQSAS